MELVVPKENKIQKPITEIHQSELHTYAKCGKMWEFRYLHGIKTPPSAAITVGRSVDYAVTQNLAQKIQSGADLPESDILDACATEFDRESTETDWGSSDRGVEKDSAIECAKVHHSQVAPGISPAAVQERFVLETDAGYNLAGIIDYRTTDNVTGDTKTASKRRLSSYSPGCVSRALQPAMYSFAHKAITGKLPKGFRYDVLVKPEQLKTKRNPATVHTVQERVTTRDVDWLLSTVDTFYRATQAGVAMPAPEGSWWCSSKWCGYWSICKGKK